ncbi:MAG: alpha-L-fucosidase [Balneolaceae bacterium]|nr:alpha-L-fucosidase [Balneolaceae bacterium]
MSIRQDLRYTPVKNLGTYLFMLLLVLTPITKQALGQHQDQNREFEPTVQSLQNHEVPEWFEDAKLGIFIHWGLYSVPAWAPLTGELGTMDMDVWFKNNPYAEWYLNSLRIDGSPTQKHHYEHYGKDFNYYDFSTDFNSELKKWDPAEMASLFKEVNARYVVLTSKHHDGYLLWPSNILNPYLPFNQRHTERDVVGELTEAVRDQGLRMGLYYSGGIDWSFKPVVIDGMKMFGISTPESDQYADYVDAHWRELIDKYQPAILWNDINYPDEGEALEIFADYYNEYPDGVINNRWGQDIHDFTTPEYAQYDQITPEKWESTRGIDFSFGYNRNSTPEQMPSVDELVDMFVDIVSKNGNLLLNVGPKADGTIPELQVERLRGLGEWLDVNGEAIFGTRPWVQAQGETAGGNRIRFTQKGNALYATLLDEPAGNEVVIQSLVVEENAEIQLLGHSETVDWEQQDNDLRISLPGNIDTGQPAHSIKITPQAYRLMKSE